VTKPSTCRVSEPSEEVSFGATTNPETGAAINKRTSKIGIRCPALMDVDVMGKYLEVLPENYIEKLCN
tara:strand:- start:404 stop:607 length:204 start_codon:yes stop_codon:yes gene_type:complete